MQSACAQAGLWHDDAPAGRHVGLWINVSPVQFGNERLVDDLAVAITSARIDPQQVTVEVTESSVIRDARQSTETLHRLRSLGVSVSIDDFGTGYSSLAYLKHLPLDTIKIDRTFVAGLDGEADRSIVEAVIALAHGLRISVVAEGIETEAQFEILRAMGCDTGQGYLFARPLPEPDAARLLSPGRSGASTRAIPPAAAGSKSIRGAARTRAARARTRAVRGAARRGA